MRGVPWTALPGAPADLNPPSALPEWAAVTGGSCGAQPHTVLVRALLRHAGVGSPCGRDPRGSRSSRIPPPRVAVPSGGGGVPSAPGGQRAAPVAPKLGGGVGGGDGGAAPRPPAPLGVGLPSVVPGVPPRGILAPWRLPGSRGRQARSGRPQTGQCGGGGGGGGSPPALVRAPVFPGPASDKAAPFAPSWAPPVRQGVWAPASAVLPPHPGCSGLFGGGAGPPFLRSASVRSWA